MFSTLGILWESLVVGCYVTVIFVTVGLHAMCSDKQPRLHLVSRVCDRTGADIGGSNAEDLINLGTAMHHFHKLFPKKLDKALSIRLVNFVRMSCRLYPLGL